MAATFFYFQRIISNNQEVADNIKNIKKKLSVKHFQI